VTGDFNGDGKMDFMFITPQGSGTPSGANYSVELSNGTGFTYAGLWGSSEDVDIPTSRFVTGDFDGGGKSDLMFITPEGSGTPSGANYSVELSTGSELKYAGLWEHSDDVDIPTSRFVTGDFDGGGKSDLMFITPEGSGTPSGANYSVELSTGSELKYAGLWEHSDNVEIGSAEP
jgi:hypothetical protein